DLLLVEPAAGTFLDVTETHDQDSSLKTREAVLKSLRNLTPNDSSAQCTASANTTLPRSGNIKDALEFRVDLILHRQAWRMIVRIYEMKGGTVYVVRAYAREKNFDRVEPELRKALDSFRVR